MLKPTELARVQQEEILLSAAETGVDDDVPSTNLGRLEHLEAEPLLTLLVVLQRRSVL